MSDAEVRPTPSLTDKEAVRLRLQEWLSEKLAAKGAVTVSELVIPEATGMSNITLLFDARWQDESGTHVEPMVGRLQPQGQKLTFPEYNMGLQYDIMASLGSFGHIPVPPLFALETCADVLGMPFYIMGRVEGHIPPDIPPYHMDGWLVQDSPEVRARLWWTALDTMADLHRLDLTTGALAGFLQQYQVPRNLAEQLQYWQNYYRWALEGVQHKHCETALDWLHQHAPTNEPQALCWGDSRMANVIFSPNKDGVAALLDWEMLTLGNPLQDLAWWIYMDEMFSHGLGFPRLEGLPGREESAAYWAEKTGYSIADLNYYLVFAGLRISLLLARMSVIRGDEDFLRESFASQYMMKLLQECQD